MIYVVLGMHKSGTSLVSEILHHSGIDMVDDREVGDRGYDQGNKYEREEPFQLNNDLLDSHGVESIYIPFPQAGSPPDASVRARMAALVETVSARHDDWGFKDPRLCLTYPAWRTVLPDHRVIGVYRSLYALTERYGADRSLGRARRLVGAWHEHNHRLISYLEDSPRSGMLLSYERLMSDDRELGRLERFIGRPAADRRRAAMQRGAPRRGWRMRVAEKLYARHTGRTTETTYGRLERLAAPD